MTAQTDATSMEAALAAVGLSPKISRFGCLALNVIRRLVDILAISLLISMVALIFAQVVGRYFLNYSISWSEEGATFVQVWLVMLGAGIAMRNRQHAGIDMLVNRCPLFLQRLVKGVGFLLAAWLLIVIFIGSFSLIAIGLIVKSAALQMPLAIPYAALPVGMAYFLLELTLVTIPDIYDPKAASLRAGEPE